MARPLHGRVISVSSACVELRQLYCDTELDIHDPFTNVHPGS